MTQYFHSALRHVTRQRLYNRHVLDIHINKPPCLEYHSTKAPNPSPGKRPMLFLNPPVTGVTSPVRTYLSIFPHVSSHKQANNTMQLLSAVDP